MTKRAAERLGGMAECVTRTDNGPALKNSQLVLWSICHMKIILQDLVGGRS